ncbi:MAG: ATP-binding cassette domain-containing protein [Streptosporangiaceae bacterium]
MLAVHDLEVGYDGCGPVLHGIELQVAKGRITVLLGPDGAGKTTLLRAVSGLLGLHDGAITRGTIELNGSPLTGLAPGGIIRHGVGQVLEGRRICAELTVEENLRLGAHTNHSHLKENLDRVYELFPRLHGVRKRTADRLPVRDREPLAIGRALMSDPAVLLLDEPSLGLDPDQVGELAQTLIEINDQGTTMLLAERNTALALPVANHGYVLADGKIVVDRPAAELGDLRIDEAGRRE